MGLCACHLYACPWWPEASDPRFIDSYESPDVGAETPTQVRYKSSKCF